jgi:hypothetical protein
MAHAGDGREYRSGAAVLKPTCERSTAWDTGASLARSQIGRNALSAGVAKLSGAGACLEAAREPCREASVDKTGLPPWAGWADTP